MDLNFVRGDHRTVSVIFIGMGFLGGSVYQTLSLLPPPQFLSDTVSVALPQFLSDTLCCPLCYSIKGFLLLVASVCIKGSLFF